MQQYQQQFEEQITELLMYGTCVTRFNEDTTGSGKGLTVEVLREAKRKLFAMQHGPSIIPPGATIRVLKWPQL